MSLALRRFRLDGIGPPGARFDPLAVDLTIDGGAADASRTAVLFLENGGGKSVLLRLLFAVVLPGRRYTVGSVKLDGYVSSGDTGHVALEWQAGDRPLVTGSLLEWRNRTRSGSTSNLLQLWYSFVPRSGVLTLDDLPTRDGDRRVTRTGFRERLAVLAREHPELELVIEDSPSKWADHLLRSTPLDPETFRYQRQMNADEADAESLFSGIRTDDDFVRFVVEAVHDPEQIGGFGDLLVEYAAQLGRREQHETEARFCTEAATALRPLGTAEDDLRRATVEAATTRRTVADLRARLTAGADAAAEDERNQRDRAEHAARRGADAETESKRVSAIAAEMRRLEAAFRHEATVDAEARANDAKRAADRTVASWQAVSTVIDAGRCSAEVAQLQAAQEAADRELEPLRRAAETAASHYAGRLVSDADALDAEATEADAQAVAADDAATARGSTASAAERAAGEATAEARGLRERVADVGEMVDRARGDGIVAPGEPVADARRRAEEGWRAAVRALGDLRTRRRTVAVTWQDVTARLGQARGDHHRAAARLDSLRTELDDHRARAAALIAQPRVQQLAPGAEDAWLVADQVEHALDRSVLEAEATVRSLRAEIEQLDARIERLGADGLLPAPDEVERVLDAVVAAGIGASTGWQVLAHNRDEDGRARALATNPALAGGVIISNPERLDDAVQAVADAAVETDAVVLVGTEPQLDQPGGGRAAPVRRALYDPSWTERARAALLVERDELVGRQDAATEIVGVDQPLLSQVRDLMRRCPAFRRDQLTRDVTALTADLARMGTAVDQLAEAAGSAEDQLRNLEEEEPQRLAHEHTAGEVHRRLTGLDEQVQQADTWASEAEAAEASAAAAAAEAGHAAHAAIGQRRRAEAARSRARQSAAEARDRRDLARRTSPAPQEPPADRATEVLQAEAEATRRIYESEQEGRDLTPRLQQAQAEFRVHETILAALDRGVRAEATDLARTPGVDDTTARHARLQDARRVAADRAEELSACIRATGAAKSTLGERTPREGRQRYVVLPPHLEPADADIAAHAAIEHQRRFGDLTQQMRQAQAEAAEHTTQAAEAQTRGRLLRGTVDVLPVVTDEPDSGELDGRDDLDRRSAAPAHNAAEPPAPWVAGVNEATEAARAARQAYDDAAIAVSDAGRRRSAAEVAVRGVANDPTLATVSGVRVALADEPIDSLARRALALADELDDMRRSVEAELADALRHREGIVQRLATLVEGQLRQLKLLTRLSTLPPGLGDWSGKPFLSVSFEQVSAGEITARLGPIVDEATAAARPRPPLDVVLAGMRAAVMQRRGDADRTFTVRLLRPNRTMSYERASIGELEREFSGGMKLTAAICTYCALAALRANSRSTGNLFGVDPGPLFLDNPLGKASADYLLELQHKIAAKVGVQLVHTTGVWDVEALGTYERVVRLRNLADLRRNVRRLRVDDEVHLHGAGATIDAVGFSVRLPAS